MNGGKRGDTGPLFDYIYRDWEVRSWPKALVLVNFLNDSKVQPKIATGKGFASVCSRRNLRFKSMPGVESNQQDPIFERSSHSE